MYRTQHIDTKANLETPQDEARFLSERASALSQEARREGALLTHEEAITQELAKYRKVPAEHLLAEEYRMKLHEIEAAALSLGPNHDEEIDALIAVLESKGIKNALSVAERLNNPHVEDDFHRFLIQYVAGGGNIAGLNERAPLSRLLRMRLFEIALPPVSAEDEKRQLRELISAMEHFYAGMRSVTNKGKTSTGAGHFTLEISNQNGSNETVLYAAVPLENASLFEKQILASYPRITLKEHNEDYNPFNGAGATVASFAALFRNPALPLKSYREFDHDPFLSFANAFSKLKRDGEGAAIQIVLRPADDHYAKRWQDALKSVKKGVPLKEALATPLAEFAKGFWDAARELTGLAPARKKESGENGKPSIDDTAVKLLEQKISAPVFDANIRLVASAADKLRADSILVDLESVFHQFEKAESNKIVWRRPKGSAFSRLIYDFSFRAFSSREALPLTSDELSAIFHVPARAVHGAGLRESRRASAPLSREADPQGILIGINRHRGSETPVHLSDEDRMRHFYCIGQTGTGKTTLLKNMIAQDIARGAGVCMIDPHGGDITDILSAIPPERREDVIYFDPAYTERPMGLNMLEYDRTLPEQKTFVVNELFSIFNKLFDMKVAGGPMFEQYFRNATLLVIEDPDTGSTLLEIARVFANPSFRELKLSRCHNPVVVQFWRDIAAKAGGEAALANIVPYITSKIDVFLANDVMRPIVAQEKSAFSFRAVMDERKILLVNLSKGRLGDINSHLIGLIVVGKILMAALSRSTSFGARPSDFFLYIDEFQNVTTDSTATILSEARKYRLSLHVAHQFIGQLDEKTRKAVFGNVGSLAAFRVGTEDATALEPHFAPVFSGADLMNLNNHHAAVRMLAHGEPLKPFSLETVPFSRGTVSVAEEIKARSFERYGRARGDVETEIMRKYGIGA